ncbi:Methyltransferase domain-containing protein [Friedmanniella luteola]|uniref:Methyltransferase domain-containing protein n=1 Tax=Friedmanniella luteola TaxID=546871 RepID=A0A1H1SIN1_9ACTN|nr:class I SAM-dependent methyltransferase [Friedmanniella luteola]SDS47812.1 Methyltransferase domain-containing protein [Friedmanniella luteola]
MTFAVAAEAYGRFMGRWSEPLAVRSEPHLGLAPGQRALDVGSGPGALTAVLVAALGAGAVTAVDPSPPFVEALRARLPGVTVQRASAEALPFPDATYDLTAAQLVVHFLTDPVRGLAEMRRVTRPGGRVVTTVWDHAGGGGPLALFWRAVSDLDPAARGESDLPGTREGHLVELAGSAGLVDVQPFSVTVARTFVDAEEWWEPFTLGVGPAGAHVARLDGVARATLRDRCRQLLPPAPFTLEATAWGAVGRV